jgi:signal transduction histidine kinase
MRRIWWHVATAAALLGVAVIVVVDGTREPYGEAVALGTLATLGACYFVVARAGFENRRAATLMLVALLVGIPIGAAFSPNMATMQCIAYPLIWALSYRSTTTRAVVLSSVLATATALGLFVSFGMQGQAAFQAIAIQAVSLALGVGIGLWFSSEVRQGDENTRLLEELTAMQGQLAAAHRESGAAAERERLALELHDTIAQSLTSLVMLAQRSQAQLPAVPHARGASDPAASTRAELALIEEVARDALTEARALVAASAPVIVDGGLRSSLERIAGNFRRETDMTVITEFGEMPTLPTSSDVVLLRAAQEALANVRKHSGASTVRLSLGCLDGYARLTIVDNGRGPGGEAPDGAGFGLAGMQQRLGLVGGTMRLDEAPGGGARLTATLPLAEAAS